MKQLVILKRDFEILKSHLTRSNLSDYNKQKLFEELKTAAIVDEELLPADAICLDSYIEILEVETGQCFRFQLVASTNANLRSNKISISAPIGIALLGYRTGATVEWEMPTGLKIFKVLKVKQAERVGGKEKISQRL